MMMIIYLMNYPRSILVNESERRDVQWAHHGVRQGFLCVFDYACVCVLHEKEEEKKDPAIPFAKIVAHLIKAMHTPFDALELKLLPKERKKVLYSFQSIQCVFFFRAHSTLSHRL